MKIVTIGIDLGKNVFHLHGVNERGKVILKKKVSRSKLIETIVNIPSCLIGLEACSGAYYWAREFTKLGHTVRLMAPQFVKPYVKSNKNDYADAEAICEAVTRPTMRFVAIKEVEQQDILSLHRIRERLIKQRTALGNEIRSLLHEYGIVIRQGFTHLRKSLAELSDTIDSQLTPTIKRLIISLYEELNELQQRIIKYEKQIDSIYQQDERCQRLGSIPGVGKIIATAMVASIGNAHFFENVRQLAAWIGLVPAQRSTGGKSILLGISKRGDQYLRTLLIHGARSVLNYLKRKQIKTRQDQWLEELSARRGKNRATVALANKTARIIGVVLTKNQTYQPQLAS
ncbi:MAG: IS110 family transposase [Caedibacter sp. 37-49]|nr:MAG: IS110 family transposase [Caedibacter sp. 37-49]